MVIWDHSNLETVVICDLTITRASSNTFLKRNKNKNERHKICLNIRVPGPFPDLLWVPGCSCNRLKVFWNQSENQICMFWQQCCRMLHCGQCRVVGRRPYRAQYGGILGVSEEFWDEKSYQLWWWQTILLFLLPKNIFWMIILPSPNINIIHYIILSLGSSECFMVLTRKHGGKPKGKTKVSTSDIIEI